MRKCPHGSPADITRIGAARSGYASFQGQDRCNSVIHANPRGPGGDFSRIGAGCDGTANFHGRGKHISAIHRRARHATEAPGRPVCVEGGKEMCPPARPDPAPGQWKAHGRRRWIAIPCQRKPLLSLSPAKNVNYTGIVGKIKARSKSTGPKNKIEKKSYSESEGFIVVYTLVTSSSSSRRFTSLSRVALCSSVTSLSSTLGICSKPPEMSSNPFSSMNFWICP